MRAFVFLSIVLAGCAARYRTEHVGTAQVVAGGGASSISLGRGTYQMSMQFDVPRAQVVAWTLRCPGVERAGQAGETFEAYRTRRLAELNRMVEQDRRRLATVTNAVTSQVGARVQVRGPGTTIDAEAAPPTGEAIAEQAIEQIHELPGGDVGMGSYTAKIRVQTFDDGACTVTTQSLDPVGGSLAVDRIRDLRAEEQERQVAQRAQAIDARVRVRARLVSAGADEQARARRIAEQQRRRAEEARLRAELEARRVAERDARRAEEREARVRRAEADRLRLEAEARVRWEAEAPERARRARLEEERRARLAVEEEARRARLAVEEETRRARLVVIEEERRTRLVVIERERTRALTVRGEYIAWLVGTCNADPHRRARLEQERIDRERRIEFEREERRRIVVLEREERTRRVTLERERVERVEREREQRQLDMAFAVRAQLTGYLVGTGARLRPPRPAPLVEVAGTAPFDSARWESGTWVWIERTWQWRKGGWVDSTRFGNAGGEVHVRAPAVVREIEVAPTTTQTATTQTTTTVDVSVPSGVTIAVPGVQGSISIDVKPAAPRAPSTTVRDHRRRDPRKDDAPPARVRDHRRR
jgi:hypothetical protein